MKAQTSRLSFNNSFPKENFSRLEKHLAVSPGGSEPLNVVLLYEDEETREWAREAFQRVTSLAGKQAVRPAWWKLASLNAPGVLAAGVSTAMRADVIIVCLRGGEGLPLAFYAWISSWSEHHFSKSGVLMAVIGKVKSNAVGAGRVADYLRGIAKSSRLTFLIEERDCAMNTSMTPPRSGILQPMTTRTANGSIRTARPIF